MFEHLKNFKPDGTAWLEMPELGERAEIQLKPATEQNRSYYNGMLKASGKRARSMVKGRISTEDVEKNRREDRKLYPKHVIVGWKNFETEESRGKTWEDKEFIEFTPELAAELCEKLPPHLFDRIRNFAATPEEFYPEDEVAPDPQELAGN